MIFNKRGHLLLNYSFHYGDVNLKIVKEYCYLGIIFTPAGSFQSAMTKLRDKALKAYFKIFENLRSDSCSCSFTLFRSLVQPIASYGSEVWSPYLLRNLNDNNLIDICDKLPAENLHIKLCKLILGVHKKATNHAVRGELGSYPLFLTMISLALKYWWNLNMKCLKGDNSLVIKALVDNRKHTSSFTWSSGIKGILKIIDRSDIWDKPNLISKVNFNSTILSSLQMIYDKLWVNSVNNHLAKLRTYCTFKQSFSLENYVLI